MFLWSERLRLFQRRTVWCPTWLGFLCIFILLLTPVAWWFGCGESFLSLTAPLPAEILVVEGWIGEGGMRAAATEFEQRGYQYVVATGGLTDRRNERRWSYAEMAKRNLIRFGVSKDKIILAPATDTESHTPMSLPWRFGRRFRPEACNPRL